MHINYELMFMLTDIALTFVIVPLRDLSVWPVLVAVEQGSFSPLVIAYGLR